MLNVAAALLISTLAAIDAVASSVIPLDLDQITAGAQHIVHVRCTKNEVQADAAIGVVTVTAFVVLDRAKGRDGTNSGNRRHQPKPSVTDCDDRGTNEVLWIGANSEI